MIKVAGASSVLLYVAVASLSRGYGDLQLVHAGAAYGLCSLLLAWTAVRAAELARRPAPEATLRQALIWLVAGAVVFRLVGVFTFPVFEDDFYRYLWDGRMTFETGWPYGVAPADSFGNDELDDTFETILDGINYPWVATVYGPTLQWMYAAGYLIASGEVWPLQWMSALADIGVLLVLLKLCAGRWPLLLGGCLLYAWSPLLIKEFATTAHPDVIGVLFVMLALLAYCRERWFWLGLYLGVATGVKPFALVIAPFLLGFRWRAILGFGVAVMILTLAFLWQQPIAAWPVQILAIWLPEGLRAMGDNWLFNAPLYFLAGTLWTGPAGINFGLLKQLLIGSFALLWFWQLAVWLKVEYAGKLRSVDFGESPAEIFQRRLIRLGQLPHVWLFGVFLLVVPVLNPWYLVWWLPFAVLRIQGRQWVTPWVASVALGLSYITGINASEAPLSGDNGLYDIPGWVVLLEFGVITMALGWDGRRGLAGRGQV